MPDEIQSMILDAAGPFTKFVNGLAIEAELSALPMRRREQVWQDAVDIDWQGDLEPLPWIDVTSTTLRLSRSIYERIQDQQTPMDALDVAIRYDWPDLIEFDEPDLVALAAAQHGAVWLLRDVIDVRRLVEPSENLARSAAAGGHLDAVVFLHERMADRPWNTGVGFMAAKSGNLDLVAWLKAHRTQCIGVSAFQGAAVGNRMHVVRWLADNCTFGCDAGAIAGATLSDNAEMLRFLIERFPDMLHTLGTHRSYVSSDIQLIQWLDARGLIVPSDLISHLVRENKVDVLEWAVDRFQVSPTDDDLAQALKMRHRTLFKRMFKPGMQITAYMTRELIETHSIDIMNWLIARDSSVIPALIDETAGYGDPALVEWWHKQHGRVFGQHELEVAIRKDNSWVALHLLESDDVEWDLDAARAVALSSTNDQSIPEAIEEAAARRAESAQ
ncbi:hypothetical protein HK105_206462 [Polyrhizophydium stewartii]|uniref:Ankyrin repeat protein n=1 Tax=Polyrhizophydium stewartii TaxID=2732419 RepID=A0ABR4N3A2_9FUNG